MRLRFRNLTRILLVAVMAPLLYACTTTSTQRATEIGLAAVDVASAPWRIETYAPEEVVTSVRRVSEIVSADGDLVSDELPELIERIRAWVMQRYPWIEGYTENELVSSGDTAFSPGDDRLVALIVLMADLRDLGFLRSALATLEPLCRDIAVRSAGSELNAYCERNLGYSWLALSRPGLAEPHLERALVLRTSATAQMHSQSIADLGNLEIQRGDYTRAGELMQQSHEMIAAVAEVTAERMARSDLELAAAYAALGRYDEAEGLAQQSMQRMQANGIVDHPLRVDAIARLGSLDYARARFDDAMVKYEEVYALRQRLFDADYPGIGSSNQSIGNVKRKLGDVTEALTYYDRALAIYTRSYTERSQPVASVRSAMGSAHAELGQIDAAIEQHGKALEIRRSIHPSAHAEVASSLGNLGLMFGRLGRTEQQEQMIREALSIAEQVFEADNPALSQYFNLLGYANRQQGRYRDAVTAYEAALKIREEAFGGQHEAVARILTNIGDAWLLAGERERAVEYSQRAVQICERAACLEAGLYTRVLNNYAEALPAGRVDAALATLVKARATATALEFKPEISAVLEANIARHYWSQGRQALAVAVMKGSVQRIHALAESTVFSNERQAAQFASSHGYLYRRLAEWLMVLDRHREAEQIFDLLNAYEYGQYTRSQPSGTLFVSPAERDALSEVDRLSGALHRAQRELSELTRKSPGPADLEQQIREREARIEELIEQLPSLNDVLLSDEQSLSARERSAIEELSNSNLENAVYQLQQLKEKGTRGAVLRYVVLPERVAIFVASAGIWSVHSTAPVSEGELARMIFEFRKTVRESRDARESSESLKAQSERLFELLVSPVLETLKTVDPEMLFLDLDQSMRYLPFGALHDGERFLSERYSLVSPVFMNRIQGDADAPGDGAGASHAFGVSKEIKSSRLGALPWVARELDLIVKEDSDDATGVVPGRVFLDEQFVRSSLERSVKSGTSHLHVASHFVFAPGDDSRSYLLLGDGSRLSVRDMTRPRRLRKLKDVSLLSLSACDTALGSADLAALSGTTTASHGSEIDGAATSAINAGARSVLATLWKVQDASTAVFMTRFYSHLSDGSSKVDALRLTQNEFANATERCDSGWNRVRSLVSSGDAEQLCVDQAWSNPFHWAGFVLLGSWN